ncbi:MAG: hypothetical protein LBH95_07225, partial [Oscillospiraceae bacterium]|nr:hypothetical protein [Oscillospiraceae bacterium]
MKKLLLILLCACLLASCTSNPPSPSPSVGENTVTPSAGETEEPPGEPAGEFLNLGDYEMADNIHVDQLGYRSDDPKRAVLPEDGGAFKVVRLSDGAVAYDGEANITVFSPGSDERVRVADFSGVTQAGEYCVVAGDGRSYPFLIGESP